MLDWGDTRNTISGRIAHGFPRPGEAATPLPPRYWVKAETLAPEMWATLTAVHGKGVLNGCEDPAVEGLEKTFNNASSRVRQADEQGSPITDTEMWAICWLA